MAGIRTPLKISALAKQNKEIYGQLVAIKDQLEKHYRDMQDMDVITSYSIHYTKLYETR